jgi:hypothetical protein
VSLKAENIKKLMGWCPNCKKAAQQTKQSFTFVNTVPISGKIGRVPEFRTSNVTFPANFTIFFVYFMISSRLILSLRYPEHIIYFRVCLLLLNVSCYWLILKTCDAAVMVDKLGVHLQAFRLKELKIPYDGIKSVTSRRLEKRSKKISILLVIGGVAFCGFVVYMAVVKGHWNVLLFLISLLPLMIFLERKQKTRFGDLNTRLYIKTKHRKWYELTSYYSLITDDASAAEIKSSIEKHCEGILNGY